MRGWGPKKGAVTKRPQRVVLDVQDPLHYLMAWWEDSPMENLHTPKPGTWNPFFSTYQYVKLDFCYNRRVLMTSKRMTKFLKLHRMATITKSTRRSGGEASRRCTGAWMQTMASQWLGVSSWWVIVFVLLCETPKFYWESSMWIHVFCWYRSQVILSA